MMVTFDVPCDRMPSRIYRLILICWARNEAHKSNHANSNITSPPGNHRIILCGSCFFRWFVSINGKLTGNKTGTQSSLEKTNVQESRRRNEREVGINWTRLNRIKLVSFGLLFRIIFRSLLTTSASAHSQNKSYAIFSKVQLYQISKVVIN